MDLDKFYTQKDVAQKCIKKTISLYDFDSIIEPSAGNGSFSKQIKDVIAIDIEPGSEDIVKADFLNVSSVGFGSKLFIGNPPFGKRSLLAKKFIKKAISLDADTIAFILPKIFSKLTNQVVFPKDWRLVYEETFSDEENIFMVNGEKYFVPCGFYIWTKNPEILPEINLRQKKLKNPPEFMFLSRESKDADFVINGNNGKIKRLSEVTNPKAEHYIKILDKKNFSTIKKRFKKANYKFFSSVNGKVSWIGQQEIIKGYLESFKHN